MSRVLIVNMPFSNLRWPNLGPSLLKAGLARRGIGCDVAYFNFDFAELIGLDRYYWIADHFAFVMGGERLFAGQYFRGRLPDDESYYREVLLAADPELDEGDRRDYEETVDHVGGFLDHCTAAVDWSRYAIVGFATSFQQTMASVCLAQRIKRLRPRVQIVFGGAACEGQMGIELLRQFPLIDYVFLGEADLTFPPLAEQIISAEPVRLPPGVVGRDSSAAKPQDRGRLLPAPDPHPFMVHDMDRLPYPDFDDYFGRLKTSPLKDQIDPLLFFETSRGCWWGEKHHCVFCGLNGSTMAFRSKSATRAVGELRHLVDRYDVHRACSSDNILDHRYFSTFLPMLKKANLDLSFVYEMKTNMSRAKIETLLDAGLGAAQLGIETFSTPLLKLVGKGAKAVDNLQTLKWFSESGIEVKWNILYGFPNEDPREYARLAELLPSLFHLAPPLAIGRVRMDRFAPYFEDPAAYGMANARASRAFGYVYPFSEEALGRIAYYYEYDYADGRDPMQYARAMLEAARRWQELKGTVTLRSWDRGDGVLILHDTRPGAHSFQHRLSGLERAVYLFCDSARSLSEIVRWVDEADDAGAADEADILQAILDEWVNQRIMAFLDDRYLSLALRAPSADEAHS